MLNKDKCLCCNACLLVCPKDAIKLTEYKGFLYPEINEDKCVKCGLCDLVCNVQTNKLISVHGVKNKNSDDLKISTSGGVYLLLARSVIESGGTVYGANDDNGVVKTSRAECVEEALNFCGSKYVHCDVNTAFAKVLDDLSQNREVLFCGTSCQVNGLNHFLKIRKVNTEKLITLDFICHGTPSPRLYKEYIEYVQKIRRKKVKKYNFRSKRMAWGTGICTFSSSIEYDDGKVEAGLLSDSYMKLFFDNLSLKNACYDCPFVGKEKPSDLTVGDFWGIEQVNPDFYSEDGVSLLAVNSQKGREAFECIKNHAEFFDSDEKSAFERQRNIHFATDKPFNTDEFWTDFDNNDFSYIMKKYANYTVMRRLKRFVKRRILRR